MIAIALTLISGWFLFLVIVAAISSLIDFFKDN